jgi:hypothetical protein
MEGSMRNLPVLALAVLGFAAIPVTDRSGLPGAIAQSRIIPDDGGQALLKCYHRTGLFERAIEIGEAELARRGRWGSLPEGVSVGSLRERYGAEAIRFIRIYWRGAATSAAYQTDVAVMTRLRAGKSEVRTAILASTSAVPAIERLCATATAWREQLTDGTAI